ncbi:MAG TPA: lysozyme [Pseudonocardiaceae bacterium]|jgi:GH25 family lysozyme M1 (1,4-beta-N-acetylmuramidase)|nr:lysozyme [Pseudonocardiaceae bacterium]
MKSTSLVPRGIIATVLTGGLAGVLALAALTPAAASTTVTTAGLTPAQQAAAAQVTHPQLDWLGSQVAKHPAATTPAAAQPLATTVAGMDVSAYQGTVNWSTAWANGAKFVYIKATEGTYYTNPDFSAQYNGSYNVGMIRGSYHFATPNTSSGAAQADYFIAHGGGWSADGHTLPGMLDLEWNPYGADCYGLSASGLVSWVLSFSNEYHAKEHVWPTIYTATSYWSECTGNTGDFSSTNPLFVANYSSSAGTLPYNWGFWTFWQYADSGTFPGDQDKFNGAISQLQAIAKG